MEHILLLTDRDWTHPQGGGTGANLFGQVAHWLDWGYRVTVVAGTYPGAEPVSRPAPGLELHHMGTRTTVFPRAAWAVRRGLAHDADVVLEVVNGITFLTPLWLKRPRVTLVHHIHRDHYVTELGRKGAVAALLAETVPLRLLYSGAPFLTISESAKRDIVALGVPEDDVHVGYLGVVPFGADAARAGRDAAAALPGAAQALQADRAAARRASTRSPRRCWTSRARATTGRRSRPRSPRVASASGSSCTGTCPRTEKAALYAAGVGQPDRVLRRGLVSDRDGGRDLRHPERGAADRRAARVDRRRRDRPAGRRRPGPDRRRARLVDDAELRERLGEAARERASRFTWERTARESLELLEQTASAAPVRLREVLSRSETLKAVGMAAATMANNALAADLHRAVRAAARGRGLRLAGGAGVDVRDPGRARLSALQVAVAREIALGRLGEGPRLAATLNIWRRRLLDRRRGDHGGRDRCCASRSPT